MAIALLAGGLAACSSGPEDTSQADAEALAEAFAAGMEGGDLSSIVFASSSPEAVTAERDAILEPLGTATRTVAVQDVVLSDDKTSATATLDYAWDVGGTPWSYSTELSMAKVEDAWQTSWTPGLLVEGLQAGETLRMTRTVADRADVLGEGGTPIVTKRPVKHVGIDKTAIDEATLDSSARALAEVTEIDADAYAAKVIAAGPKAFVEAVTLRTEGDYDWDTIGGVPGALFIDDELPLAPTREFASQILGRAGAATAEIVEESDGAIMDGDVTGLSGLQRQYDTQLRGTPGLALEIVGADDVARDLVRVDPIAGTPLATTLNADVQTLAEQTIAGQTVPAAIVAIRPSTGAVLAAASGAASDGLSTATVGTYAPGSTFKVVTALALLRAGVTPDTPMQCTESASVDGRSFQNYPDYPANRIGDIALRDVIANSCNTAIINAAGQVSQADLTAAGQALGLGLAQQPGPGVFTGDVPADAAGTEHAASMIGQGTVQASPLAMATVAASVAAGSTVRPTFLAQEAAPVESDLPTEPSAPLTADEASQLRDLMRGVVTDGGATFLQDVPGEPVSAKTGTAQYGDGSANHVWMIAFQGDLAVAVFVETGEYGSTTAGPLLESFLTGLA